MAIQDKYPTFLSDQRQFFDELITEDWDTYFSPEWDFTRTFEVERLFERVQPRRVLDVGCGVGFHDRVMAAYACVEQIDAIDYSERSVEKANATYPHPKVHRFAADFLTFAWERPYDLVVSFQVFEHFDRPDRYLARCAKLAAPGGRIAIVTPNRWRLDNVLRVLTLKKPLLSDPQHFREYTVGTLMRMARAHGLAYAGHFGSGLPDYGLWFLRRMSTAHRCAWGYRLPAIASNFCLLLKKV
jgi:2-polyprenyl-3-methyl-5-hydroxy-6-metoxy-1,4-benzoquinol methylase